MATEFLLQDELDMLKKNKNLVKDKKEEDAFDLNTTPKSFAIEEKVETVEEEVFDPNTVPKDFATRDKTQEILDLRQKIGHLCTMIEINEVPKSLIDMLLHSLSPYQALEFDEDFNIRDELVIMMKMVKAVRNEVIDPAGRVKEGTTIQEVKSVLDSSLKLSSELNKVNKDLINQERMQAVEASFMEVVATFPKENQIEYIALLERRMKTKKELQKS